MSSDDVASDRVSTEILEKLIRTVDVGDLQAWQEQPLDYDVGAATVRDSVFGKLGLPVVWEGEVMVGSQIVDAEKIDPKDGGLVMVIDLSPLGWPRHRAMAAAIGELTAQRTAYWDDKMLADLVTQLHEQDAELATAAGWDGDALDELIAKIEADEAGVFDGPGGDEDDAPIPEPPKVPVTKRGDIWTCGPHRIMCGDCRDADDVAALLDGATINLGFTSPPYADRRTYDETSGFKPIPPDEYVAWFEPVQANVGKHLAGDGSWFVNIKEHCTDGQRELYVKDLTLAHPRTWGWAYIDEFCWRRSGVPGRWPNRFKNSWEPVFHFATTPQVKLRHEAVAHSSDRTRSYDPMNVKTISGFISDSVDGAVPGMALPGNVIDVANAHATAERGHTAEFPVALPDFFVRAYTDEGDTVYDPFMGSGSTLLAAHQNDRIGYGMEISPAYVDVILTRFQRATQIVPTRNGEPHDFIGGTHEQ